MGCLLSTKSAVIDVHGTPVHFQDLDIQNGDFVLIKGPNGYGKSSFLKMIVGRDIHVNLTSGDMYFPFLSETKSLSSYSDEDKGILHNYIAYVAQEDDFFPTSSIFSAIYTTLKFTINHKRSWSSSKKKQKKKEAKEMIKEYLNKFYASGLFDENGKSFFQLFRSPYLRSIYSCSGGQRKMCQIVAALIKAKLLGARMILMDEPLNNLDKNNKKILNNELREVLKLENPPAIMMVTHCHIFFGVNKEIELMDEGNQRIAKIFAESNDKLFSSCLVEGGEKDGMYHVEMKEIG